MAKVILYKTSHCPWCHKAEEWFKAHKVQFVARNVEEDDKAAEEMVRKSGQRGVPVIDIDGKIVIGYDEPELKRALKIK